MCQFGEEEKPQALPFILKKDALDLFADHQEDCKTYKYSLSMLRDWNMSTEQRDRVLVEWK